MRILLLPLLFMFLLIVFSVVGLASHTVIVCATLQDHDLDISKKFHDDYDAYPTQLCYSELALKHVINVFSTEYVLGVDQIGKIFVQLLDEELNETLDDAACVNTIFYPNGTKFIELGTLVFLEDGIYENNFVLPDVLGVYPVIIFCDFSINITEHLPSTQEIRNGTVLSGNFSDVLFNDGSRENVRETGAGGARVIDIRFNFTNITTTNETAISIQFDGQWNDAAENVKMFLLNFSSSTFVAMPNEILNTASDILVSNLLLEPASDFINGTNVTVRFADDNPDSSASTLKIDMVRMRSAAPQAAPLEHLKGAGEVHMRARDFNVTELAFEILASDIEENLLTNHNLCDANNTNLIHVLDKVRCINLQCVNISTNVTELCPFGCNNETQPAECNPAPFQVNLLVVGILMLILVIVVVAIAVSKKG